MKRQITDGRKCLQIIYLISYLYLEYIKNSYNSKRQPNINIGKRSDRHFSKKTQMLNMKRWLTSLVIREMQIKTIMRYHLRHTRMPKSKSQISSISKDEENWNPHTLLVWIKYNYFEKLSVPRMIKSRVNHMAQKFHSQVYILEKWNETCPRRNLHMNVHSSVIHNSQKVETTQVFINKWTNKMYSHIMEYLVIKWNEVLIRATTWINLENILSESNQLQKTVYYMIPLIQKSRTLQRQNRLMVS